MSNEKTRRVYRKISDSQYEDLLKEWKELIDDEPPGCGISWLWHTGIDDRAFIAGLLHDFDWAMKWEPRCVVDLKFSLRVAQRLLHTPVYNKELGRLTWKRLEGGARLRAIMRSYGYSALVLGWKPDYSWEVKIEGNL